MADVESRTRTDDGINDFRFPSSHRPFILIQARLRGSDRKKRTKEKKTAKKKKKGLNCCTHDGLLAVFFRLFCLLHTRRRRRGRRARSLLPSQLAPSISFLLRTSTSSLFSHRIAITLQLCHNTVSHTQSNVKEKDERHFQLLWYIYI